MWACDHYHVRCLVHNDVNWPLTGWLVGSCRASPLRLTLSACVNLRFCCFNWRGIDGGGSIVVRVACVVEKDCGQQSALFLSQKCPHVFVVVVRSAIALHANWSVWVFCLFALQSNRYPAGHTHLYSFYLPVCGCLCWRKKTYNLNWLLQKPNDNWKAKIMLCIDE